MKSGFVEEGWPCWKNYVTEMVGVEVFYVKDMDQCLVDILCLQEIGSSATTPAPFQST